MTTYKCCQCNSDNSEVEVTVQKCKHVICWECLKEHVVSHLSPKITCPVGGCVKYLSDGAIRKVLTDELTTQYEQMSMGCIKQTVKCLLPGCSYTFICYDATPQFECGDCHLFNCGRCRAPHRRLTCQQFRTIDIAKEVCQEELQKASRQLQILNRSRNRQMFLEMDANDLLLYDNLLECPNCCRNLAKGDGVVLRCSHLFCRYCLSSHIKNSSNIPIICPSEDCSEPLYEREILEMITNEEFGVYIDRCNSAIKGKLEAVFQCQTPNCMYLVTYDHVPDLVHCPLCKADNCTKCHVVHTNETCARFKERVKGTPYGKNLLAIEEKIRNKELMRCIKCHQLLQKISGCSWIQCSNCSFEMCWALQMRRWGPKGRGDNSGGCGCKLLGPRCTTDCGSCEPHHGPGEQIDGMTLLRMLLLLGGLELPP